jgi:hypothetical protein
MDYHFMASIKKGTITAPRQWWKHLKEFKRDFWKRERKAHKKKILVTLDEGANIPEGFWKSLDN